MIIHTDAGTPYITVIDNGKTFDLQLQKLNGELAVFEYGEYLYVLSISEIWLSNWRFN